jgi:hypothetical protein
MMQLAFQTPPAFHVQPFVAGPTPGKPGRWVSYLMIVAVLAAALLSVGSARAGRSTGAGIVAAVGDWVADLDEPEPSQP